MNPAPCNMSCLLILGAMLPTVCAGQDLLATYMGGRFGYSSITLELYTDSTFHYSSWVHTGQSVKASGVFTTTDSTITLLAADDSKNKGHGSFQPIPYRMKAGVIKLYTVEDEKENPEYFHEYHTLYLKKD